MLALSNIYTWLGFHERRLRTLSNIVENSLIRAIFTAYFVQISTGPYTPIWSIQLVYFVYIKHTGERAKIVSLSVQNSGQGRRVRIVCKVSGQPPPKVTWFKDGRSISRNRSKYQFVYFRCVPHHSSSSSRPLCSHNRKRPITLPAQKTIRADNPIGDTQRHRPVRVPSEEQDGQTDRVPCHMGGRHGQSEHRGFP